jgi:hypothetical protein
VSSLVALLPKIDFAYRQRTGSRKLLFKQVHKLLIFLALLWAVAPPSTQAQGINCPSGFASTGDCGVGFVCGSAEAFLATGISPALSGNAVDSLVPAPEVLGWASPPLPAPTQSSRIR